MKTLIIAEKPSVATDIARALGKVGRKGDHFENDEYVISSAIGHLVELCKPDQLDKKWRFWTLEALPIIPEEFRLQPIEKAQERYELLAKLMARKDVGQIVNACDAGREGELIFRYIVRLAGIKKRFKRLWLSSMTPSAIREGFGHLRDGHELDNLADAATCRSESDWLIGINGTRAFTRRIYGSKSAHRATVGRVQTPTLAMLVEREERIRAFQPKAYWEVTANFGVAAGEYQGKWFDEAFKKGGGDAEDESDLRAERIWDEARARAIQARCEGRPGEITEETKPTSQAAPLLYDLTTLQREANGRFGFSARRTLQVAQSLYERHKMITYPRTDSRALPEDYPAVVLETLGSLAKGGDLPAGCGSLAGHAATVLQNGWVQPNRRIFNNAKVSDHFAIIPTGQFHAKLDEAEAKLFDMIAKRFIAVFFPSAKFEVTTRITRVEGEPFKTEGKILREPGWLAVYGREAEAGEGKVVPVVAGEKAKTLLVEVAALETRPPARYTEATILTAMETAGKLLEDEELREAMKERGLGTPATRASIIEGLIYEQYVHREGRELVPSSKAISLIELLRAIKVDALVSPALTGEWEHKLREIEHGHMSRGEFMAEIKDLTRQIVDIAKTFEETDLGASPLPTRSPIDGAEMIETFKAYKSVNDNFTIWKTIAGRRLEREEAVQLIEQRKVGPLDGFRSKAGKTFSAGLRLTDEWKVELDLDGLGGAPPDFSGQEAVGRCPVCGGGVFETPMAFICERAVGAVPEGGSKCVVRISKKILGRDIPREQAAKLLAEGKTDLLEKFWSRRTRRPFSAWLMISAEGRIGFGFPPRERKGPKASKYKPADGAGGGKVAEGTGAEAVAEQVEAQGEKKVAGKGRVSKTPVAKKAGPKKKAASSRRSKPKAAAKRAA
ncbi:MAG: DNA topoisomerase III [Verrucomicrobiae bacterium]|nr:DNA topoisomerase III [Verrucomicrobiae bacterium]